MTKGIKGFQKGYTPYNKGGTSWNKGMPCIRKRCKLCGGFLTRDDRHVCRSVDIRGQRFCIQCKVPLNNKSWERYSKICGRCGKKIQNQRQRDLRKKLIEQFGGKCKKCGYKKFYECLEFHHLDKKMKKGNYFLGAIIRHPDKFELLCNRCHREVEVLIKRRLKNDNAQIKVG